MNKNYFSKLKRVVKIILKGLVIKLLIRVIEAILENVLMSFSPEVYRIIFDEKITCMIHSVLDWFKDVLCNVNSFISGLIALAVSYFAPIKNPLIFLVALFVIDCLVGAFKNWKLYREPFSKRKVFETTVPRMLAVALIISLLYSWDTTFKQEFVNTYMVVGYFIGGVLLWNVIMNLYKITKWKAFIKIGRLIDKNVEEKTTMKIDDDENK